MCGEDVFNTIEFVNQIFNKVTLSNSMVLNTSSPLSKAIYYISNDHHQHKLGTSVVVITISST